MTYSLKTLTLLKQQLEELEAQGINPGMRILEMMVQAYGYKNLEDAQQKFKENP